jgi:hypothetical protein
MVVGMSKKIGRDRGLAAVGGPGGKFSKLSRIATDLWARDDDPSRRIGLSSSAARTDRRANHAGFLLWEKKGGREGLRQERWSPAPLII